jgi:hypothetical protein
MAEDTDSSYFFPWQELYEEFRAENDPGRLRELATEVETALFLRSLEIAHDPMREAERRAIAAATAVLRAIQEQKLGYSKWNG